MVEAFTASINYINATTRPIANYNSLNRYVKESVVFKENTSLNIRKYSGNAMSVKDSFTITVKYNRACCSILTFTEEISIRRKRLVKRQAINSNTFNKYTLN